MGADVTVEVQPLPTTHAERSVSEVEYIRPDL